MRSENKNISKESFFFLKYFYLLAGLFFLLAIAAIFYVSWEHERVREMEELLVEYHKATITEVFKIEEEFLLLEKQLSNLILAGEGLQTKPTRWAGHEKLSFSAAKSLEMIVNHQSRYKFPEFLSLLKNLKTRWQRYQLFTEQNHELDETSFREFQKLSESLRISLDQLKRLHMAGELNLIAQIKDQKKHEVANITTFVSFLILLGIIASFMILTRIRQILKTRHEMKQALQKNEVRLRAIVENVEEGIVLIDQNSVVESVNPAVQKIFGFSPGEIIGKNMTLLVPGPYKIEQDDPIANYKQTDPGDILGVGPFEVLGKRIDGSTFPLEFAARQIYIEKDRKHVIMVRDLTERKRMENLSTRMGRILNNSFNEIYIFDATTLKFVQVNHGARENLGYAMEELTQLTPLDLKPRFNQQDFEELIQPLHKGEKPVIVFETVHKRKDGSLYPVEVRLQLMHEEKPPVFVAIIQNITERKKSEMELEKYKLNLEELVKTRTQNLEETHNKLLHSEKLAATGKLSASIAHEFNNPLCGIKNVLEEVHDGVKLDADYENLVGIGIKECDRIAELIRKLRDLHLPSPGNLEAVDIHKVIDEIIVLIKKKLRDRKIKLENNYANQIPEIEAVPDQIKQVILNLLNNAEESIPNGSEGEIRITTEQKNSHVKIHIQDTGCGISPENLNHIFDPFFTTKSAAKGTGLGLSICHGIVKAHRGEIDIESQPDRGTRMTLTFPVARNQT